MVVWLSWAIVRSSSNSDRPSRRDGVASISTSDVDGASWAVDWSVDTTAEVAVLQVEGSGLGRGGNYRLRLLVEVVDG